MTATQFLSFMVVPAGGIVIGLLGLWLVRHQDRGRDHKVSRNG